MFTLPGKSQKCWCVILLLLSIATAGSAQEKKRAVPDEVALTKATGLIREMYKDEFEQATSAAAQMKLARQLAEKARVMNDDPAACYALLREAGSLAYKADAFPVMLKVIDEINERYVVDAWDLRSKALSAASDRNGKWDGDLRYRLGLQLAVEAAKQDRFEQASQMCTLAKKAAEQLQDADSIDYIEKLIVRLQLISQAQKVEKELIARLDASPTDPDANLALGKLYCFQQGNWEKGISMLALGNDADIKPIAEKDLEAPTSAADQLLLADRWWTLAQAQQEPFKGAMLSRAGHWYRSAQPKLTGLLREKAGKRLAQSPPQARSKKTMLFERPGGSFYGCRSACIRPIMLATGGGNDFSERAVTMALVWLANHQLADGSWSLQNFTHRCVDGGRACTGIGQVKADSGATAMGLLPFLAAGQTHKSKGPYTSHIAAGIHWLIKNQQPDGNLAKDAVQPMYSHGLCTIALAEAFGLSNDPKVGKAAQLAVNYILAAQNPADGGWRYHPRDPGDTSVVGWQLMALKSARASGLNVGGTVFQGTSKWLDAAAVNQGSEYAYQPGGGSSPTMTSVGILCREYLGAKRDNPMIAGGTRFLMARLPNMQAPNIYCWYYSTQAMHNVGGKDWDAWNREVRDLLVNRQNRDSGSCAFGSWAPPVPDTWATHGGRVMMTSLAALTLEVYYRYPPLYGE